MKKLVKFTAVFMSTACLLGPLALSANSHAECKVQCPDGGKSPAHIHEHDVLGHYQISGFSNSFEGSGTVNQPQSQAVVGQIKFKTDGRGVVEFINLAAIVNGNLVNINQENTEFAYTLSHDGSATATFFNFPQAGVNSQFRIAFKQQNGCVTGFSAITVGANTPTARWTLIQGKRFW